MRRLPWVLWMLVVAAVSAATAAESTDEWHGFVRHRFQVDGCEAWLVEPEQPLPGKPWSWCLEFPDAFTDRCAAPALLAKGFHHAHIVVGNTFGAPAALAHFDAFYAELRKRGLGPKPALIGLSRGGLYAYRWASAHPDQVSVIYGDAPVCDFKSWPGGKGTGKGSPGDWQALIAGYGFRDEAEALAWKGNPVDTLEPLAKAGVPLVHVVGDADDVVPVAENTALVEQRYKALGGTIQVIHKPGVGHHPHGLDDPTPVVDFIVNAATTTPMPGGKTAVREWFVAPDGQDGAAGTKDAPFATLGRAQAAAQPGDTVWIRAGTYAMRPDQISGRPRLYVNVIVLDKSGREGAPIRYFAWPGERPVFDFSAVKPPGRRVAAFHVPGSWIHLRGLDVRGVQVTVKGHTQSICFHNAGNHNVYEQLSMHDGQAIGWYGVEGAHNLVLNCDAWQNHDFTSENGRGGNVDGFGCHPVKGAVGNVFRGCRAWLNSDDGYDLIMAAEPVVIESCWAMRNGLDASGRKLADGNGFKAGGYAATRPDQLPQPVPRHVVRFCLAVENRAAGFYANHHLSGNDWLSNSAFGNSAGFSFLMRTPDNATDVPGTGHRILNNLGFRNTRGVTNLATEGNEVRGSLFDDARLTSEDFVSIDPSVLTGPRQADGSLPDVPFLRPSERSQLIDAGVETGLSFAGKAPDVGCFERR